MSARRPSAYELFAADELDPVICLKPAGITESNKLNVLKLAGVLGSFGDFKDKKYRLKLKREQSEMIQAVRYLLEKSATESKLGKRRVSEKTSRSKRQKTCDKTIVELSSIDSELNITCPTKASTGISQAISLQAEDVEAALTLQCLSNKFKNRGKGVGESSPECCTIHPISDARASLNESDPIPCKQNLRSTTTWYMDSDLYGSRLKNMLVTIRGINFQPNEQCRVAYEGTTARIISVHMTAGEVYASVKLIIPSSASPGRGEPLSCSGTGIEDGSELRILACYLAPVQPDKCDDPVIILHMEQGNCDTKGLRGLVRSFIPRQNNGTYNMGLVGVETTAGRLQVPRACLAKCFVPNK